VVDVTVMTLSDHAPLQDVPEVAGIVTAIDILATARFIVAQQEASGAIVWPDGHVNPWDHVECAMALTVCGLTVPARRAFGWLAETQRPDGSWPKRMVAGQATDQAADSNQVAYVAAGVWHELLVTGDEAFASSMWPTVERALEFVLALQTPRGEIIWERTADGSPGRFALLAGCSSIYHSLRCAMYLASYLGHDRPEWETSCDRLGRAIARCPEAFADKSRFSMDWYYPVLTGPVRGDAARERLAASWEDFVVPGLGVRCVSDQPWVTGAESCELVMALAAIGDRDRSLEIYADIHHLRESDGSYWTGWQFVNQNHFPVERSSWTAAAVILAADVLSGTTKGANLFSDIELMH
jgi:hypothetical protein